MFLSRLDLHGFKSFAQKTTVEFAPGVTAIVGPNGCGKSNVIDAVRWVLGEQRARLLRSDKMEGVLFNGAEGRRPLGMAEVSLTVENTRGVLPTEFSAVTVTRRLFRNGDSEYLLNGTQCRLRDVQDLFLDTGLGAGAYSVIELSMVEDILSENAADRRRLFEEAAGVTRYKRRREGALKRLAATEADLTRLDDILEEVDKQVRALARQASKAQKAARLAERLRALDLALAAHDFAALEAERQALAADARARRDAAHALAAQNAQGEAGLEAARLALVGRETRMGETARARAAHAEATARLDAERRVAAERHAADARTRERLARETAADADRETALASTETETAHRLAESTAAEAAATAALATATAARDRAARDADAARAARDAARTADATAAGAARAAETHRDRTADRRALLAAEAARLSADQAALTEAPAADARELPDVGDADQALATADAARTAARAALDTARTAADAARTDAADATASRDAARAETALLRALVESGDGAGSALAALAEAGLPAVPVADLVACDAADRLALDAALGPLAEAVVVDTAEAADRAVAAVRAAGAGRAAFVVADTLTGPADRSPVPPGARPAASLARAADARAEAVVAALLANVFVVDALADARRLAGRFPVARFVTPDGLWTGGGILRGGSPSASGRLGLAERQAAAADALAAAEARLADALAAREAALAAVTAAQTEAAGADAARDGALAAQSVARQALARLSAEAAARDAQAARLAARAEEAARTLAALPDETALATAAEAALAAAAAASTARADAEAAFDAADAARRQADAAHADARLAHARAASEAATRRADAERLAAERRALAGRVGARAAETARLDRTATDATAALAELDARLDAARPVADALRTNAEAAETAVLEARAAIADAEKALRTVRSGRDAAAEAIATAERRLAEIAVRQETLTQRLADDHGADLDAADEAFDRLSAEEGFEPEAARAETPRVREALRALGAVNALALGDYEQEAERLAFLQAQRADLAGAEATLRETIREINAAARERFGATFAEIQTAFSRLFTTLFGGDAEAHVTLGGDDPLEAPVLITARPRGKRPVSITQLSGGEKTLTATALLFAIYLVKPSPFCILDEVDAPLDDANVDRFMQLVREFSDTTQFILVTHNKLTMEAADRMYGVTMPTPGVSRLVGVRLDEPRSDGAAPGEAAPEPSTPEPSVP